MHDPFHASRGVCSTVPSKIRCHLPHADILPSSAAYAKALQVVAPPLLSETAPVPSVKLNFSGNHIGTVRRPFQQQMF